MKEIFGGPNFGVAVWEDCPTSDDGAQLVPKTGNWHSGLLVIDGLPRVTAMFHFETQLSLAYSVIPAVSPNSCDTCVDDVRRMKQIRKPGRVRLGGEHRASKAA